MIKIDRHATNINPDGITTIQEIYNNLASNVSVSEVYIISKDLNPDLIDPVTQAPETPILMFDDLIADDASGGGVIKRFEAEIYEYHLMRHQIRWFEQHTPTVKQTSGLDIPMISGQQVITCDNTVYNMTLKNADRTGMVFVVPFFGPDGNFKGMIAAIIRLKVLRGVLPGQNVAMVNPHYGVLLAAQRGWLDAHDLRYARQVEPDPKLIYSEVLPISAHDPRSAWSLWTGVPNAVFDARPDLRSARVLNLVRRRAIAPPAISTSQGRTGSRRSSPTSSALGRSPFHEWRRRDRVSGESVAGELHQALVETGIGKGRLHGAHDGAGHTAADEPEREIRQIRAAEQRDERKT